jgi:hypothetical protein
VVVGISGLRWSDVSATATPTLWRLAGQGSVGSLVDYAVLPLTCPADAWLTLNSGARAQSDHTDAACGTFPAVTRHGTGAQVTGLPALESYNSQFGATVKPPHLQVALVSGAGYSGGLLDATSTRQPGMVGRPVQDKLPQRFSREYS